MDRLNDLRCFYEILDSLEKKLGGKRKLETCNGRMDWPVRGVYFFFENGENRTDSGTGLRVVRVGTHALKYGSKTTLWDRLSQHQGNLNNGGGNHRGSIFRLHVGTALVKKEVYSESIYKTWGVGSNASREVRQTEIPLEKAVSQHIRQMPFLWLAVEDETGPDSLRGVIERNSIALLSNYNYPNQPLDSPSDSWLGNFAKKNEISRSGLWNVNHVVEKYDPTFLFKMADVGK